MKPNVGDIIKTDCGTVGCKACGLAEVVKVYAADSVTVNCLTPGPDFDLLLSYPLKWVIEIVYHAESLF
jgi:hypothetical protein